jgi:hypothetical protein
MRPGKEIKMISFKKLFLLIDLFLLIYFYYVINSGELQYANGLESQPQNMHSLKLA